VASVTDRLLTPEEVADLLQVNAEWVRDAARRGAIASVKLGHYRRFLQSDVDAFVASHRVVKSPEQIRSCVSPNKETTYGKA
jgi:excisionase family DNA binding protein